MNAPITVRPARVRAEAQKKKKKEEREARAAKKLAVASAVAAALQKGRTPFLDRLSAALQTNAVMHGDVAAYLPVRQVIDRLPEAQRPAARAFVVAVEEKAPGLCLLPLGGRHDVLGRAVVHMSNIESRLLRKVSTWTPRARGLRRRWDELVAHTCCAYPQPRLLETFFLEQWITDDVRAAAPLLGMGASWRSAGLPCTITRATAHVLSTSKARLRRITTAIRFAQAQTVGVTHQHRRALLASCPAWQLDASREDLWLDFFGWLGRHPTLPVEDLEPIADAYAYVEPTFSTRGRTPASFTAWAKEQARQRKLKDEGRLDVGPLPRADIDGGAYVLLKEQDKADARRFIVEQIVDGLALVEEGIAMKHCVGTYATQVKEGTTAIFSLKVERYDATPRRALTIEVELKNKSVEQVRGKTNRSVDDDEKAIIACWASERGLKIDQYAY